MSIKQIKDSFYIKLAYQQAEINLGSTSTNPSVRAVIVKNNSVISSARTSLNGRPHAESNAFKKKLNYKNSDLYVTLEPCSHYGKTPPCTKKIISKKINRVVFSINDSDVRSKNLASKELSKKKIKINKFVLKNFAENFYKSYFMQPSNKMPFIDGKLAISKDFLSNNYKYLRMTYPAHLSSFRSESELSKILSQKKAYMNKRTPTEAGTYYYQCSSHSGMVGTITIEN